MRLQLPHISEMVEPTLPISSRNEEIVKRRVPFRAVLPSVVTVPLAQPHIIRDRKNGQQCACTTVLIFPAMIEIFQSLMDTLQIPIIQLFQKRGGQVQR